MDSDTYSTLGYFHLYFLFNELMCADYSSAPSNAWHLLPTSPYISIKSMSGYVPVVYYNKILSTGGR